jgi:alpha-D-xyloside xylohydrolase
MYVNTVEGKATEDFSVIKNRAVYLPAGTEWYDFWTGEKLKGGQEVQKAAPVDLIPLYVKAGSIMPFGQKVQYSDEKKWDNLEIRVYQGADGEFTLYEDEKNNYNYEKGVYSTISFTWNDTKKSLTVNERKGSFPGMLTERKFKVVIVSDSQKFVKKVIYKGTKVSVKL